MDTFFAFDGLDERFKGTQASSSIPFEGIIDFDCRKKGIFSFIERLVWLSFGFEPFTLLAGAVGWSIAGGV